MRAAPPHWRARAPECVPGGSARAKCINLCTWLFVRAQAYRDQSACRDYPIWVHVVIGVGVLGLMMFALTIFVIHPGFWDAIGGTAEDSTASEDSSVNKVGGPRQTCE